LLSAFGSLKNENYNQRLYRGVTHMAKLPRYSLSHDEKKKRWVLKHEGTGQAVKSFATKAAATKGGVLEKSVGKMGSVRIRKRNGQIQEERTYPRSTAARGAGGGGGLDGDPTTKP
jgi:hypothetical protein